MKKEKTRLEFIKKEIEITLKANNENLKTTFSNNFLERLSILPKKTEEGNAALATYAAELLEHKKKSLTLLENAIQKLNTP